MLVNHLDIFKFNLGDAVTHRPFPYPGKIVGRCLTIREYATGVTFPGAWVDGEINQEKYIVQFSSVPLGKGGDDNGQRIMTLTAAQLFPASPALVTLTEPESVDSV